MRTFLRNDPAQVSERVVFAEFEWKYPSFVNIKMGESGLKILLFICWNDLACGSVEMYFHIFFLALEIFEVFYFQYLAPVGGWLPAGNFTLIIEQINIRLEWKIVICPRKNNLDLFKFVGFGLETNLQLNCQLTNETVLGYIQIDLFKLDWLPLFCKVDFQTDKLIDKTVFGITK